MGPSEGMEMEKEGGNRHLGKWQVLKRKKLAEYCSFLLSELFSLFLLLAFEGFLRFQLTKYSRETGLKPTSLPSHY